MGSVQGKAIPGGHYKLVHLLSMRESRNPHTLLVESKLVPLPWMAIWQCVLQILMHVSFNLAIALL